MAKTLFPKDHSSVREYPNVLGLKKNLFFLTHSVPEVSDKDEAKSHANHFEAEFAVQLAKYLKKQGYMGAQVLDNKKCHQFQIT
jgi:phosphatidylethanolamine-binding protein (PEBP) family uncharacterized protein